MSFENYLAGGGTAFAAAAMLEALFFSGNPEAVKWLAVHGAVSFMAAAIVGELKSGTHA